MEEKATVNLCGVELEVVLPRFYFHSNYKEGSCSFGSHIELSGQCFTWSNKDYRHISSAELIDLMKYNPIDEGNLRRKWEIFSPLLLAYFLARGIDLEEHKWRHGIYTNNGVRREGQDLIVFRNIDGKIEELEDMYDCTEGYKIKDNIEIESQRFSLERLFRKYGKKLEEIAAQRRELAKLRTRDELGSMLADSYERLEIQEETVPLKHLDKSNPDLVDYLFGQEYEELPETVQRAEFLLPPDTSSVEGAYDIWPSSNIWPLFIDMSFGPKPKDKATLQAISHFKSIIQFGDLVLNRLIIYPYHTSCGFNLLVREKGTQDKPVPIAQT